ncbi:glycoside hydrolase family 20 zincin-like fold domain-containing protein [Parapedobacter koreensis]|uniref:Glycosyl hydrolase family 20, domain 2 n=1 Tax=Parapedobacter koreensis TaxID=332977 RepID=A0A1H7UJL8_9SPHI|nr:glycoside hydrolase family 20 zincin-like fold domain-containing protein [Parapedobacter koreensis]SEL96848.1 Glycosyl hydrolase family 20, domain 2 [Parapedobacter koreensis]
MKDMFFLVMMMCVLIGKGQAPGGLSIVYDSDSPREVFGAILLRQAYAKQTTFVDKKSKLATHPTITFMIDSIHLAPEAYAVKKNGDTIAVKGGDATGVMYGATDLADRISLGENISAFEGAPYLKKRGIKFNIPLDARTPSYDDRGDAAQHAISTVWEFDFWQNFIENMARYRYNVLSLWIPHPFPSMVKIPEYPDVALDNVCVYTGKIRPDTRREWDDPRDDIQNPANLRIIKQLSIDEKIAFWKKVFSYAADLGIEIHLYTWNVFVYGAEGKHGITWEQDNPITIDYVRQSVKQFLLTYPNVKAIGLTAGEHIDRDIAPEYGIENWLYMTYGKGIMDAKAQMPSLDVRIIFRQHHTKMEYIRKAFEGYDGPFETEFKYSRSRMFSSVVPPFFDKIYRADVEQNHMLCWMNVRNDDCYVLRWGDPVYAADYIKNIPYDVTAGFIMGGDGYVYGKDFASKHPDAVGQYEMDKHWYYFMIWGRASYDPDLPANFYINQLSLRFPEIDASALYHTWRNTAAINSWVNKLHFGPNDYEFCFEGSFRGHPETREQQFVSINDAIAMDVMPEQSVISIAEYANDPSLKGITPFDVADSIDAAADQLLNGMNTIPAGGSTALSETLGDFHAWARLGRYYAAKFRGATWTALLRKTGKEEYRGKAIASLRQALNEWTQYAAIAGGKYKPQTLARQGRLDYYAAIKEVENDIEIAKQAKQGEPVALRKSNKLWEIKSLYY